jgi:hypothetical protein
MGTQPALSQRGWRARQQRSTLVKSRFRKGFGGREDGNRTMTANQEPGLSEEGLIVKNRQPWEPMQVTYLGNVAEVVRQGGGKITILTGDPGEPRKVPPTG